MHSKSALALSFSILLSVLLLGGTAKANELTLSVALGLSSQQAEQVYRPLVNYLSNATGQPVRLKTSTNALAHWQVMRREGYDLVIDGPAFTAYRAAKMGYTVIAKFPDVLSFTLIAHADQMVFDPSELIGRQVASQPSPSLGALGLAMIYSNPMRQPDFLQVDTHIEAGRAVEEGRALGAMVPSPLVPSFQNVIPVYTTEQFPSPGISVSGRVSPEVRDRIREALVDAQNTPAGRTMLEALNIPYIEAADNSVYLGHETMLEGLWGY